MRCSAIVVFAILVAACFGPPPGRLSALAGPARSGDVAALERLLSAGASPNITDPGGNHWTPLLHAIHKGQAAAVDLLLRRGANPRLAAGGIDPLLMAVGSGHAPIVRRLLEAGADPRSDERVFLAAVSGGALSDLDTPLLGRCNTEVVKTLQEKVPDLRVPRGRRGHLAMIFARLNHCSDVIALVRRDRE
jgi:ankyrin repeat protein